MTTVSLFSVLHAGPTALSDISDLAAAAQTNALSLTYTPIPSASSYEYRTKHDDGSTAWTAAAALVADTITGLTASVAYDVQLRGTTTINGLSVPSAWSNTATGTPTGSGTIGDITDLAVYSTGIVTSAPTYAPSDTSTTVTFTAATGATSHQYRTSPHGANTWSSAATLTNRVINGLSYNTNYDIEIRGTDGVNFGNWSNLVTSQTWSTTANLTAKSQWATYTVGTGQTCDATLNGAKWNAGASPTVITFSFPALGSYYTNYTIGVGQFENQNGFAQLSANQQASVREILNWYGRLLNVVFVELTESATVHAVLRYAMSTTPPSAWTYFPGDATGGDMWFNPTQVTGYVKGSYSWYTFMHETGHALGLKHPFSSPTMGGSFPVVTNLWTESTIMSYASHSGLTDGSGTGGQYRNGTWGGPQTPMKYDIAALQFLYGANIATEASDTTYSWDATTGQFKINGSAYGSAPGGNTVYMTVWDGGGRDTYDMSNFGSPTVDLTPGNPSTTATAQLADQGDAHTPAGTVYNALENAVTLSDSDIEAHTP